MKKKDRRQKKKVLSPEALHIKNIPKLTEIYFDIVLNKEKLTEDWSDESKARSVKAYELIVNKMPVYNPKLKATNTEQVLKLLGDGKVDINQAKELMLMMATEFEIKELPKLLASFEKLQEK